MEGLRSRTSDAWARAALASPEALLDDHAHLEKKAATNALDLLQRWPDGAWGEDERAGRRRVVAWTTALTAVARDEIEHLGLVLRALRSRGAALSKVHRNPYASGLRAHVRTGGGKDELLDRLLVSALIEARSCERFEALSRVVEDAALARLYRGLEASERGHHRRFLDLAAEVVDEATLLRRWPAWLEVEARVLAAQAPGPRVHAGEPA